MKRCLPALMILALGFALTRPVAGQDLISGVDLMYPEFAHAEQDAAAAIHRRDFRFIAVDRARRIVPGMERTRRLRAAYGTKVIRQRFRLFPNTSQNFSYNLRARSYAEQYNRALAHYLLKRQRQKQPNEKRKGAPVSGSALHFDGDKPNSVDRLLSRDDHLSRLACAGRPLRLRAA